MLVPVLNLIACIILCFRKVFTEKFNIAFGYPRKDTCSTCDAFEIKLKAENLGAEEMAQLIREKELHVRKGQVFYDRKSTAGQKAKGRPTFAALAFDFSKNLPAPNISTNDVYYRRQLSLYSFNVHSLPDDVVFFYCYDETMGKKGADDVASMLLHYFDNVLSPEVTHVELFCDSCAGQNKNWTVIRFLHHLVAIKKRFVQIKLSFPIRGHSYMECDRDMCLVNQKAKVETPADWMEEFRRSRQKPSPFNIVAMEPHMFQNVTDYVKPFYRASCPIATRPLREIVFSQEKPQLFSYRISWNGPMDTAVVTKPVGKKTAATLQPLRSLYQQRLPIKVAKYKDLQVLKQFCSTEAQHFFESLPYDGMEDTREDSDSEISEVSDTE